MMVDPVMFIVKQDGVQSSGVNDRDCPDRIGGDGHASQRFADGSLGRPRVRVAGGK